MPTPEEPEIPPEGEPDIEGAEEMMSPEDFAEMIGQIPALKEMLEEMRTKLAQLGEDTDENKDRKRELENKIEDLGNEIALREEVELE